MSQRRIATMEVMEVLRRLRMGESDRSVAACLGHTRRTVAKYRAWAEEQGVLTGALPTAGELHRLAAQTLPAPLVAHRILGDAVEPGEEAVLAGDTALAKHRMRRHLQALTEVWRP